MTYHQADEPKTTSVADADGVTLGVVRSWAMPRERVSRCAGCGGERIDPRALLTPGGQEAVLRDGLVA